MKCPNDDTTLAISDRQGVEIDYCPTCRGVWLDRGELDKLIERANAAAPAAQPHRDEPRRDYDDDRRDRGYDDRRERHHDDDGDYRRHGNDHNRKHKKEGFLGDIFDF